MSRPLDVVRGMLRGSAARFVLHRLGLRAANSQLTEAERRCLARHAAGRRRLVEIGVMHGVTTALLRSVMHPEGEITGIDPHPPGRLGMSFERAIARRELARHRRGRARLLRMTSHQAAQSWQGEIDFLFIDGDHSWQGIDTDWRDWSGHVVAGGLVALHDSLSVGERPDLPSVRYTAERILTESRFRRIDSADSLTVLKRCEATRDRGAANLDPTDHD